MLLSKLDVNSDVALLRQSSSHFTSSDVAARHGKCFFLKLDLTSNALAEKISLSEP
jgi:hypothetical protein